VWHRRPAFDCTILPRAPVRRSGEVDAHCSGFSSTKYISERDLRECLFGAQTPTGCDQSILSCGTASRAKTNDYLGELLKEFLESKPAVRLPSLFSALAPPAYFFTPGMTYLPNCNSNLSAPLGVSASLTADAAGSRFKVSRSISSPVKSHKIRVTVGASASG
jgi:hypothetical protein